MNIDKINIGLELLCILLLYFRVRYLEDMINNLKDLFVVYINEEIKKHDNKIKWNYRQC